MNITNNLTCNDFGFFLVLLILLVVAAGTLFFVWRSIRHLQAEIQSSNSDTISEIVDPLIVGHDGELYPTEHVVNLESPKRKRKEPSTALGCLNSPFAIALIGLVTAIVTALAATNPLVIASFETVCNLVNIPVVYSPTSTPVPTDLATIAPSFTPMPSPTLTYTPIPSPTHTETSTVTPTATSTETAIPTVTSTASPIPTATFTATSLPTLVSPTAIPVTATTVQIIPLVPTPTPSSARSVRRYLTQISVPGNSSDGVQLVAEQSGTYEFRYAGGAYSTNSTDLPPWRTAVFAYIGSVQWEPDTGNLQKLNESVMAFRVADGGTFWDQQSAINSAIGRYNTIYLRAGQILRLVAVDHLNYYSDNPGQVALDVYVTA